MSMGICMCNVQRSLMLIQFLQRQPLQVDLVDFSLPSSRTHDPCRGVQWCLQADTMTRQS